MPTYFGYVEREADNYINWADVSRDLTTTFNDINRVREEKKQALDDDFRAELKKLTLQPKGKSEEANKFITEYGDNASNFLLMQNRLLKAGKSKLKDYIYAKQNVSDGTDNLFKIMKDYQANYGENMERYEKQISSKGELWNLSQVEKFADFSKSGAYIAGDGSVSVAMKTMKNVDGQEIYTLDTKPGEVASLSVLSDVVNKKINRYKANDVTTELAKAMGVNIESAYINGEITSIEDITRRKYGQDPLASTESTRNAIADLNSNEKNELILSTNEKTKISKTALGNEGEVAEIYQSARNKSDSERTDVEKKVVNFVETKLRNLIEASKGPKFSFYDAETDSIKAALPTPESYMSVLVDNKQMASNGKPYDFKAVNSKEEAAQIVKDNPNLICMLNGSPVLTEGQEGEAIEFMRGLMRAKYTLKEVDKGGTNRYDAGASTPPKELNEQQIARGRGDKQDMDVGQQISNLYSGDQVAIDTAIQFFKTTGQVKDIRRDMFGIKIIFANGTTEQIPFFVGDTFKARGSTNFYEAAFNALNPTLDEASRIKNKDIAKRGVKNDLMPNLSYFNVGDPLESFKSMPGFANTFGSQDIPTIKNQLNKFNQAQGGGGVGSKYN